MKASPGGRSWMAAGIRHEIFTRALPALRHDMAAPVSVIRMGMLLLKRQANAPTFDAAAWSERSALLDEQVGQLAASMNGLRDWELGSADERLARSALVRWCVDLMRAAFELNGVRLVVSDDLAPREGEPLFGPASSLRYMVLGVLGYLNDSDGALSQIVIEPAGDDALQFTGARGVSEPADPMAGALRAPRKLAIDAVALQALAEDLGHDVQVDGKRVRLSLLLD